MGELTPEQQAAASGDTASTPPEGVQAPPDEPAAPAEAAQPGTDAPAAPADHPAAPDPGHDPGVALPVDPETGKVNYTDQAAAAPQFGGAVPDTRVDAAQSAANDPGFVVSKPLLTTGAYGHDVEVLANLLAAAGHPNAVAAGVEPPMLTDELMRHVRAFQEAQGIDPTQAQAGIDGDTSGPSGPPLVRKDHEGIVEWRTWAALYDAAGEEVDMSVDVRYPVGSFA